MLSNDAKSEDNPERLFSSYYEPTNESLSLSSLDYKEDLSDFYDNIDKAVDLTQIKNQKINIYSDSNHICGDSNLVKYFRI